MGSTTLLTAACMALLAGSAAAAPVLTMAPPGKGGRTNATPTFAGTTSDSLDKVTVLVSKGGTGEPLKLEAHPSGMSWSATVPGEEALANGSAYTAVAEQTELEILGGALGETTVTEPVHFTVDTERPHVTIVAPESPSGERMPTFTGKASEDSDVTVRVFEGSSEVGQASTEAAAGKWSATLATPLPSGRHVFTAYAKEASAIGDEEGESEEVSFEVDTTPPTVTIVAPESPSGERTPTFTGTASENTAVTVHVFHAGGEVSSATATAAAGKWSVTLTKPLPLGKNTFTAYATEESGLGNEAGESGTVNFEVDTEAPTVSIRTGPAARSNDTTPSFSGETSEDGEVIVEILEGSKWVASASTQAHGGAWSATSPALPAGNRSFRARATEQSGLGNGIGESEEMSFEVDTESPSVTIVAPTSPSKGRTPSFSGAASEPTEVTVHVFEGANEVASESTTASGGKWAATLSKALPLGRHSYQAFATEASAIKNEPGKSQTVSFEVDTEAPTVALLSGPSPRSNDKTPSFSGTASEDGEVVVHVLEGSTEVASAKTKATAGSWSATLGTPLPDGKHTYRAYATEASGLGNAEGESASMTFEVDTTAPAVALKTGPPSRSHETSPSFGGTASEETEVEVHVMLGQTEVAHAKTTASGGKWAAGPVIPALPSGRHTFKAFATEKSSLPGNPDGYSNAIFFEVNTEAPAVTIAQPTSPSKERAPTFSGTASEDTEVEVHVFEGESQVATAKTFASGGTWTAGPVSPALPAGRHAFTAYATEQSGIGNAAGSSETVSFEVDTEPPEVRITSGPSARSNDTTPSFAGTASEDGEVVVHVLEGPTEVAKAKTMASAGAWKVDSLGSALPGDSRQYTAFATEKSSLGNEAGRSNTLAFEVDTGPPTVTIKQPKTPSNNLDPSFSGTASEETAVTVHVLEGAREIANARTTASGGSWTTGALSSLLPKGKRTFTAFATEKSGLAGNGEGTSSSVAFEVNTEPPTVTIIQPPTPSNNVNPSFSGEASENTSVTVHVLEGSREVATATATASAGKWSTTGVNTPLSSGKRQFSAYATEKSSFEGNLDGTSASVSFEVNTERPAVTIAQPATPTNVLKPSFSGTASEETEVTVHVLEGSVEVASASTKASGGKWTTPALSAPLPKGKHVFQAYATEKSGLENGQGTSATVQFEVNTEAPVVTLQSPALVSNNTTPAFSGTASDTKPVTVEVFHEGNLFTIAAVGVEAGRWKTAALTTALGDGKYTAVATEQSSLTGNEAGHSNTVEFEVNTAAPDVTIEAVASPSNNTTPSFSGKASGHAQTPVKVVVHEGATSGGRIVASLTAEIGAPGSWETAKVAPLLTSGKRTFTVIAEAASSISGNPSGVSAPKTLEVNTEAPVVTLTSPPALSNDAAPSFTGTATEANPVLVKVYKGPTPSGAPVAEATANEVKAGAWITPALTKKLGDGDYTAVASQESAIGNGRGSSAAATFSIDTSPPGVTLNAIPTPSSQRLPLFSGTAGDKTPVDVEIHAGSTAAGPLVAEMSVKVVEGEWFAPAPEQRLQWGEYTAVASEESSLGNPPGYSQAVTFLVAQIPPSVITEGATAATRTTAALYGAVNPAGGPITACNFEVGPTPAYGRTVGCGLVSEAETFPPAAVGFVPVFIRIYGLTPNTTYHYRVVAEGEGGTGTGSDMTFTTLPPLDTVAAPAPAPATAQGATLGASYFAEVLKPGGKGAKIGALLRNGVFRQRVKFPGAGSIAVKWYYVPPGAKLSAKAARKKPRPAPVVVASGSVSLHAAGTATLTLRLTAQGRRLLRHATHTRLTAQCTFRPAGAAARTTAGSFTLRR